MIDYRYIEAFLAVVNTGSTAKAAEMMFVSQSSVSKWIRLLEDELGTQLIVRHKGRRTSELTASGRDLIPLAEEWISLNNQISSLKGHDFPSVRIAAIDSLNSSIMPDIYHSLMEKIPNLELSINTDQSNAIYSMVERKQYDIGIVSLELHFPDLRITPFLSEPFRAVVYTRGGVDLSRIYNPLDMDVRKNLYIPSGYLYRQWHEFWWHSAHSYIMVDPVSTAEKLLCEEGLWTIVPNGIAEKLLDNPDIHEFRLTSMPPNRMTYFVTHRHPRKQFNVVYSLVNEIFTDFIREKASKNNEVI